MRETRYLREREIVKRKKKGKKSHIKHNSLVALKEVIAESQFPLNQKLLIGFL